MKDLMDLALCIFLIAALVVACGCAGPSKARYQELLGECREQNREHVRMLQACETGLNDEQHFNNVGFGEDQFQDIKDIKGVLGR